MSESLEAIKKFLDECSNEERRFLKVYLGNLLPHPLELAWGIESDAILSAIGRSSDLTKRGVRGIIAEAVFVSGVVPTVAASGWRPVEFAGDNPYDVLLRKGELSARVQVKLQRLERGAPKLYRPKQYEEGSLFVVEVQKTRGGEKRTKKAPDGTNKEITTARSVTVKTRPYSFGDFDILAVNMHPSSGDWKRFRYTVGSWLLPRPADQNLIEIFQPVASAPNEVWAGDLVTCLGWFETGQKRRLLPDLFHLNKLKGGKAAK